MLILALDTSTRAGSVALARDGQLLQAVHGATSPTHVERLPAALTDLLAAHGAALADVDRFAVLSGPGGFTGLRVGLATVQGLALALGRPVVVASTLEMLAVAAHAAVPDAPIAGAWMRGMRGEVFAALYRPAPGALTGLEVLLPPMVGTPDEAAAVWPPLVGSEPVGLAGDGWDADGAALRALFPPAQLHWVEAPPLAGVLALLAGRDDAPLLGPHAVAPTYVRRPDAVLTRERAGLEVSHTP